MTDSNRYGRRKFPAMYARINTLRQAIRAHAAEATEAAWDSVEEFVDLVFTSAAESKGSPVKKCKRPHLSQSIRSLLDANGATHVTITLAAADARILAQDLDWATNITVREYEAEVQGSITL